MSKKVIVLVAVIAACLGLTALVLAVVSKDEAPASEPVAADAATPAAAENADGAAVLSEEEAAAKAAAEARKSDPFRGKCADDSPKVTITLTSPKGLEPLGNDIVPESPDVQFSIPESYVFNIDPSQPMSNFVALVDWASMRPYCFRMYGPYATTEMQYYGESQGQLNIRYSLLSFSNRIKSAADYNAMQLSAVETAYTDDKYEDAYGYQHKLDPNKIVTNRADGGTDEVYRTIHFIPKDVLTPKPHYFLCTGPSPDEAPVDCTFEFTRNNLLIQANLKWEWAADMKGFYDALVKFTDENIVDPSKAPVTEAAPAEAAPAPVENESVAQ